MALMLPREPKPGQSIKASDLILLLRYVKSITPREGPDITTSLTADGWVPRLKRQPATAGKSNLSPAGPMRAFWVYDASEASIAKIGVVSGAFDNAYIPTMGGYALNTSPAPTLTLAGSGYAYFQIDYDTSGNITSIEILSTTGTIPPATITPGTAGTDYWGLSTVTVVYDDAGNAKVIPLNDFVSGPQGYSQCGTTSKCFLK